MKINLLSSKVYNRIAAGEVVERPYSVVKELVENSIDAGATEIIVKILSGGLSKISITDNGCGIEKSELKKALMPHATSKISSVKDLDNISSLGFRGEALASIASVSKITIKSKPITQDFGASIYAEGGEICEVEDSATENGTHITVNNLFFNTPVRAKFLKSERSEENEISATMARFILGNPNIAFKYYADGDLISQSFGDGLESAFINVFGVKTLKDCYFIDSEKNGLVIKGYIGKPYFTKPNRSYQTLFINGRYVVNQTISSAISNAYSSYLMKRQYPFYLLNITMPSDAVDVNVHPNKTDVRFLNNQVIYGSIYSVISKVLDGSKEVLNIVTPTKVDEIKKNKEISNEITKPYDTHKQVEGWGNIVFNDSGAKSITELDLTNKDTNKEKQKIDIFAENKAFLEELEAKKALQKQIEQTSIEIKKPLKIIGQALNSFLILEDGVDLYFIDQHAAHERVLFDKLNNAYLNDEVVIQPLLIPFILNVNSYEYDFVVEKLSFFNEMGIEIDEFGKNAFKISALPSYISSMNLSKFFNDLLSELDTLKNLKVTDILKEKIVQKACKSAIKAGDKMSESEINFLLDLLKNDLTLKCPHGRPIAIKISRLEIDKWFKRIV